MKKNKNNKFIIAFDTIVDGWQCAKDEQDEPILYDTREEAVQEMFSDALSMLSNRTEEELELYNEGVTVERVKQMREIFEAGNTLAMENFLKDYPECNDNEDFVIPAEEFQLGRKTFFAGN